MRSLSADFRGFLDGLDSLHYFVDQVVYKSESKGPSFRCGMFNGWMRRNLKECLEEQKDGSLYLHYYSRRQNLYPIVKGVVKEAARRLFNTDIIIKVHEKTQEHGGVALTEHIVFSIIQVTWRLNHTTSINILVG